MIFKGAKKDVEYFGEKLLLSMISGGDDTVLVDVDVGELASKDIEVFFG